MASVSSILENLQSGYQHDPELQSKLSELKRALMMKDQQSSSERIKGHRAYSSSRSHGDGPDSSAGLEIVAVSKTPRGPSRHLSQDGLLAVEDGNEDEEMDSADDTGDELGASHEASSVSMRYDAGEPHGLGNYVGTVRNGVPHGQGTMEWPSGKRYRGQWSHGKRDGQGWHMWTDGRTFEGQWKDGKPHGLGKWTSPRGESYEGELIRGKKCGEGKFTYPDGKTYKGGWLAGLRHGQGTRHYPDGSCYVGSWANDKRHGKGRYTWRDGRVWSGEWIDGNPTKDVPPHSESGHHRINSEGTTPPEGSELDQSRSVISGRSGSAADTSHTSHHHADSEDLQHEEQKQEQQHRRRDSGRATDGFPPAAPESRNKAAAAAMKEMRQLREFSTAADRLKKPIVLTEGNGDDAFERQGTSSTQEGTTTGSDWGGLSGPEGDTSSGSKKHGGDGPSARKTWEQKEVQEKPKPKPYQQVQQQQQSSPQPLPQQQQPQQQQQLQQVKLKGLFGGAAEKIGQWGPSRLLSSVSSKRQSSEYNASMESSEASRSTKSEHSREKPEDSSEIIKNASGLVEPSSGKSSGGSPGAQGYSGDLPQSATAPASVSPSPRAIPADPADDGGERERDMRGSVNDDLPHSTKQHSQQRDSNESPRGKNAKSTTARVTGSAGHESARDVSHRRQLEDRARGISGDEEDDYGVGGNPFLSNGAPFEGSGARVRSSKPVSHAGGTRSSRDRKRLVEKAQVASSESRRRREGGYIEQPRERPVRDDFSQALVALPIDCAPERPGRSRVETESGSRRRDEDGLERGGRERESRSRSGRGTTGGGRNGRSSRGSSRSRRSASRGPPSSRNRQPEHFDEFYSTAREYSPKTSGTATDGGGKRGDGGGSFRPRVARSRSLKGDRSTYADEQQRGEAYEDELSDFDDHSTDGSPRRERPNHRSSSRTERGSAGHQRRKSEGHVVSKEFRRQQHQQQRQAEEGRGSTSRPSIDRRPMPELKVPLFRAKAGGETIRELREKSKTSASRTPGSSSRTPARSSRSSASSSRTPASSSRTHASSSRTPARDGSRGERHPSREKVTEGLGGGKNAGRGSENMRESGSQQDGGHSRYISKSSRTGERPKSSEKDPPMVEMEFNVGVPLGIGKYVGEVKRGVPDGQGTIEWSSGKRYSGAWLRGKRHGYGIFSWPDGRVHECEWLENRAHGQGTFWYGDGTSYAGDWAQGLKHGHGVRTYPGDVMYDGQWRNGLREGKAVWCGPDGMYEGTYVNDMKNGQGTYTWTDGRKYVGSWQDGKQHGQGVLHARDGKVILRGKWKKGEKTLFF